MERAEEEFRLWRALQGNHPTPEGLWFAAWNRALEVLREEFTFPAVEDAYDIGWHGCVSKLRIVIDELTADGEVEK